MHGVSVLRDKQGAVQFKPFLDNWNWKLLGQTMHVYQVKRHLPSGIFYRDSLLLLLFV